jgi:hypothetical protein
MRPIVATLLLTLASTASFAAERRPLVEIPIEALTRDTQVQPAGGDRHMTLVWWVPYEFWGAVLARDAGTPQASKDALLAAVKGVSVLGVVQADISTMGAFHYYPAEAIEKSLLITTTDAAGKSKPLSVLKEINPDLQVALGVFKPILSSAMGNLGANLHFFVLDDRADSGRVIDPYRAGSLTVKLTKSDKTPLVARIETPLDSLFVPRVCPNGRTAHVTWKFCPWNGEPLRD